jgi:hypothetical protein
MQSLLLESDTIVAPQKLVNEKRAASRIPALHAAAITGIRLSPFGAKTSLVNISATGVGVKSDIGLKLGTLVTVYLEGGFTTPQVKGRVVRCGVTAIESGSISYLIGIAFDKPISIQQTQGPAVDRSATVSAMSHAVAPSVVLSNRW